MQYFHSGRVYKHVHVYGVLNYIDRQSARVLRVPNRFLESLSSWNVLFTSSPPFSFLFVSQSMIKSCQLHRPSFDSSVKLFITVLMLFESELTPNTESRTADCAFHAHAIHNFFQILPIVIVYWEKLSSDNNYSCFKGMSGKLL